MNQLHHYGLVIKDDDPDAYILGNFTSLPKVILEPSGDWSSFLPLYESQFGDGWDTYGCAVWGTENVIETLIKKVTGVEQNYSERFIYILADVTPPGSDPHFIAETIRHNGLIDQSFLPMTKTYEEFVTPKPMTDDLLEEGLKFKYEVQHEWLWKNGIDKDSRRNLIEEALRYSPLGVSVTAWIEENGVYIDRGLPNTHWVMLFAIGDTGYKIFDSYDHAIRILSFDHNIQIAKRYHLEPSTLLQQVSLLQKILILLKQLVAQLQSVGRGIIK